MCSARVPCCLPDCPLISPPPFLFTVAASLVTLSSVIVLLRMKFHRTDAASILSQFKHNDKQIQLKRRWLLGIAATKSDRKHFKKSKFLKNRFLPEYLLREDDIFYESVKAYVDGAIGACHVESDTHILQDDKLPIDIPNIKRLISSCLDNMTTKGLYLLAMIITGDSAKLEKTRCKLKKIIRDSLPSVLSSRNHNHCQLETSKQIFGLLTNPQHFRDNCEPLSVSRSQSNHAAVMKVLNDLHKFPCQTLIAMRRKLKRVKATIPQLLPCRKGWGRGHLINLVSKISRKMLSQLSGQDELQEPLAKAMAVADLSLQLANGRHNIYLKEFYKFSPEVKSLQNDIIKAIWLVKNLVGIPLLRSLERVLEPKAKVSNGCLRTAFVKFLTEFLFECGDLATIPKSLLEILDVINRSSSNTPHKLLQKENIEEEVNSILNVSAQAKQIVLDLLPNHGFDEDFTDAYAEQLVESDDDSDWDYCQQSKHRHLIDGKNDSMNTNYEAESIGQFIPFDFQPSTSMGDRRDSNSSAISPAKGSDGNFVKTPDFCEGNNVMVPRGIAANFSCEETNAEPIQNNICKNQYLTVQDICDETSLLSYNLVGYMLGEFAYLEGLDLNRSQTVYLSGDNQIKDMEAEQSSSGKDARDLALVRVVDKLIPFFPDSGMEKLKMLIGL